MKILIKGAGDLASGIAYRLHKAGFPLLMTELPQPMAIRRSVAFAQAVFDGEAMVEDSKGILVDSLQKAYAVIEEGFIPVLADPETACQKEFQAPVIIDAMLAKRNINTSIGDAPMVIALGPGFYAGKDCHAVIETQRGHNLGRIYYEGAAADNTGVPGDVGGHSLKRLLKAPTAGIFEPVKTLGDLVQRGEIIAYCGEQPLRAEIDGCLRGLLYRGLPVQEGMKVGDIDPRGKVSYCDTVSDKARALGGAALEAILTLGRQHGYVFVKREV